ncbi:phosphoribosylformylglycinamidine synthase-like isoform X2 [Babylonia areolata]|uniref:phosphoribosylformylglycinamidine synthase-like isoform X2 n=1 Tax=Babylonia areolata TaxID=304850 RepID=UPI003FCFEA0C
MPELMRLYRQPGLTGSSLENVLTKIAALLGDSVCQELSTELCLYIEVQGKGLTAEEVERLKWVLAVPFQEQCLGDSSCLQQSSSDVLIEIGPRLNFSTAFSTNCVSICRSIGLEHVTRVEYSVRFLIRLQEGRCLSADEEEKVVLSLHDRMTQCRYTEPLQTFEQHVEPDEVFEVDVMGQGRAALEKANKELGLAFDDWDLDYYTEMFVHKIKHNPTSVECFDLAQSNSEHSRHWFFKGRMIIDGEEVPDSLFSTIMSTQEHSNNNNIIKFSDNSSAIKGHTVNVLTPADSYSPGPLSVKEDVTRHVVFTAETHNFPTGVAPFPGATTGTGGRIRDVQSTGRGAHVVAGTAGYSFGNLLIPGYKLPWEGEEEYPSNFATPAEIAVEASNGASDYGNKFGEPVLTGFARSFGLRLPDGERREYIKPIMFSGGIGTLDGDHVKKMEPNTDMDVVKVGGPVYRIGVGGGAASSVQVQGDNKVELDFGAVQRGDAEMEQKLNRVIRACVERGADNPICSIHDQGAGGNGNVLKEIAEPAGAVIRADAFQLGDPTISILELWGAEYQESNALLVHRQHRDSLQRLGQRERCPVSFVGSVTGTGKIQLQDFQKSRSLKPECSQNGRLPVDLDLEHVLASMPRKVFHLSRSKSVLKPLTLPEGLQVQEALSRVLRLPSVASKRYLTNKVDRSVTGLVAQQQCVGPFHTPLADVAVIATSYFDQVGAATAIGEQPIKGLIDPCAGARMSVAESLTNLVFARISDLKDVKCSGNWMWAAKLPGEGAALVDACVAMCDVMKQLGVAVDGGKDSLSMAARTHTEVVKAPGTLVVSAYATCPDITATVTPDLKCRGGEGHILWVSLGRGQFRLGGSALAQCYSQVGNEVPDLDHPDLLVRAFGVVQKLLAERKLTAGHDISDGGLVTCLLEMAFAGSCGISVNVTTSTKASGDAGSQTASPMEILFAEEVGLVLETRKEDSETVMEEFRKSGVDCHHIGSSIGSAASASQVKISVNNIQVLDAPMCELRDTWEETSFVLERRQANPHCVQEEQEGLKGRLPPPYKLPFDPNAPAFAKVDSLVPRVAVIREEGSNGDREMAAAFSMAGFEPWDINMQDLMEGSVTLDRFRGVAFVGGFSYADVCGSAKGWAATARFNKVVGEQFQHFKSRTDTFSLGVCNGCQLMALLGWVVPAHTGDDKETEQGVFLDHNTSQRYESRFVTARVGASPSIMLQGMEGTVFGMWVSHGEGKFVFRDPALQTSVLNKNQAALHYVDDEGAPTNRYPLNPNGSPGGLAGLCSEDGRHLATMPHPERCVLPWQCPWMPCEMREQLQFSPWIRMFQNAYQWCVAGQA